MSFCTCKQQESRCMVKLGVCCPVELRKLALVKGPVRALSGLCRHLQTTCLLPVYPGSRCSLSHSAYDRSCAYSFSETANKLREQGRSFNWCCSGQECLHLPGNMHHLQSPVVHARPWAVTAVSVILCEGLLHLRSLSSQPQATSSGFQRLHGRLEMLPGAGAHPHFQGGSAGAIPCCGTDC